VGIDDIIEVSARLFLAIVVIAFEDGVLVDDQGDQEG